MRAIKKTKTGTAGINPEVLADIIATAPETRPWLDSLLILQNGNVVFEHYFNGCGPETKHNLFSVTKSWLSCLIGIALERGVLPSIDIPVTQLLANRIPAQIDSRKHDISLRHCLAMQSGLAYENTMEFATEFGASDDPATFFFSDRLPVVHAPGTHWLYSGADSQMVAECLRACTGRSLTELAHDWLAGPLDIEQFEWPRQFPTPGAQTWPAEIGPSELRMTTRDLARFTECLRLRGRIADTAVIPAVWLDEATATTPSVNAECLNQFYSSLGVAPVRGVAGYGLHFGVMQLDRFATISIAGTGGQYGFAIPELNLTVVQTANFSGDGLGGGADLMLDVILPNVI